MLKVLHNSFSFETVLPSSFKIILTFFDFLFEKVGTSVLQNVLISVTFLVSKLLKYYFLVVLKVSYKNYVVYCSFFLFVKDLNSFMHVFCHKRCLICSNIFLFNRGILIENWKDCFLENIYIPCIKSTGFDVRQKSIIIKIFMIVLSCYLRFKFLKPHFEFCYC